MSQAATTPSAPTSDAAAPASRPVCVGSESAAFRAFAFDLDGTLLDTLPDLVEVTNEALRRFDLPLRSRDEVLERIGSGAHVLIERCMPPRCSAELVEEVVAFWRAAYRRHGSPLTKPFPGIVATLAQLGGSGCRLGVLSNKFDAGTRAVIGEFFPDVFVAVHGECAAFPRKPDPTGLLKTADELGVDPHQLVYVGDSATDMEVALAAGALPIGVSWGYQAPAALRQAGAADVIDHPRELIKLAPVKEDVR
ncbi:HAD family hydrolase [Eggerthellaceae bacterium zg-1084]|uniref:HAD family hydrolase n=1 Tax=Berryella wangjianweii TaxID=2734634 RepID=UPI0015523B6C|nr:HAD-IA family hydrolase [Berryella wangjianweii]NPD30913.1 HAD family hydrolase [Berryella wangjianweii]